MFRALRVRDYRVYAAGAFVSNIGTWMQRVAQDWLVLELTGSAAALGIVTGLQFLPTLLLSPLAGTVADRFPKLALMRLTQVAMAVTALVLGVLAVTGWVQLVHVYVIAFIFGVATVFDGPIRQSIASELVEPKDIGNAVSLNSASFNSGQLIGPAIAGVMISALGAGISATGWVIILNALSYIAVLLSLQSLVLRRRAQKVVEIARPQGTVRDGVRYLRTRPDLIAVMLAGFCVGTFGLNYQLINLLMATEVFGYGAREFGLMGSLLAVGSVLGALLAARRTDAGLALVLGTGIVFGLVEVVSSIMPSFYWYLAMMPVLGMCSLTFITTANAQIQLSADAQMRGRMSAFYMMVFMGGMPLGAPLMGILADALGPRSAMAMGGVATVLGVMIIALCVARTGTVRFRLARRLAVDVKPVR